MARKSSQSPQANRGSAQSYEKFQKSEVNMPTTSKDPINQHAFEIDEDPDYRPLYESPTNPPTKF